MFTSTRHQARSLHRLARPIVLLAVVCTSISGAVCEADEPSWLFGQAKRSITPKQPLWMSGYASRDHVAEGTLTELWAKALVLSTTESSEPVVLITLDLVGIDAELSQRIRDRVGGELKCEPARVVICCSHTHTGPVVGQNLAPLHYMQVDPEQQQRIDDYANFLFDSVTAVASEAASKIQRGRLEWGNGQCDVAVNRRNNPEAEVPSRRAQGRLVGPQDHDVPVLAVRDQAGNLQTVVLGYACHATVLSFYQWSGDYPGFAQQALEQRFPGVQAMFWAGCGADQNPLPRRRVELAEHYGQRLATAVESVLRTVELKKVVPKLDARYRKTTLELATIPSNQELQSQLTSRDRFQSARAKWLLDRRKKGHGFADGYPYPIATWKLGDEVEWIFLGGEVVVDFAVEIKSKYHQQATWVAGYSNDVMAYIPSRRVLQEGGYEGAGAMVYYGLPGPWAMDVERRIMVEVDRQLKSFKQTVPEENGADQGDAR